MDPTIDARGYSCPEPVLMTRKALDALQQKRVSVLLDNATARDNVSRMARSRGFEVTCRDANDSDYLLVLETR